MTNAQPSTTTSIAATDSQGEQSFAFGLLAGSIAAILGAALWAAITVTIKFQIGWMAVGVGFLVGFAIRKFGKGSTMSYGILGGALALLGCLGGNLFSTIGFFAQSESIAFFQVLTQLKLSAIPQLLSATFSAMDLLFYGIAVYEGYKLARLPATESAAG